MQSNRTFMVCLRLILLALILYFYTKTEQWPKDSNSLWPTSQIPPDQCYKAWDAQNCQLSGIPHLTSFSFLPTCINLLENGIKNRMKHYPFSTYWSLQNVYLQPQLRFQPNKITEKYTSNGLLHFCEFDEFSTSHPYVEENTSISTLEKWNVNCAKVLKDYPFRTYRPIQNVYTTPLLRFIPDIKETTIYVWMPKYLSVGHCSMLLPNGTYISWYPRDDKCKHSLKKMKVNEQVQLPASYEEDTKIMGRAATHTFLIPNIDTSKIDSWWKASNLKGYHLLLLNCCDVVLKALKFGGAFQYVCPKMKMISTPRFIDKYCTTLQDATKNK